MSRNRLAFVYVLAGVFAWSLGPLAISLGEGAANPFLFNIMWTAVGAAGVFIFLLIRYRALIADGTVRNLILDRARSWMFVALLIAELDVFVFVWSLRYIDIAVATILFETSPAIMILVGLLLFRTEGRFRDTTSTIAAPVGLAFVGLIFVTISQVDRTGADQQPDLWPQVLGVALATAGALFSGIKIPVIVRLGSDVRSSLAENRSESDEDLELVAALLFSLISVVPLLLVYSLGLVVTGETLDQKTVFVGGAAGLLVAASTRVIWRKANILTSNLGINAMRYATPVVALLWLAAFSRVGVEQVDFLIVGTTAVVSGNLLINFQAESRFGFRALILALWVCGTFVYFREELAERLALQNWLWPPGEYFTAVSLAATVFTLILSFRVARLVSRTNDESNRAFALFSRIDLLAERGIVRGDIRSHILRIDASENPTDLANAYHAARHEIRLAYTESQGDADRRELAEATSELDALAHSRQEGQDFGEYVALVIFAVITVALVLFALDAGATGWNGFLTEMFTMLFSAVIIFLVVNVWDLQRERGAPVLQPELDDGGYGVVFRDAVARRFEQVVSIVVVLAMTTAFGWLLWGKWLG